MKIYIKDGIRKHVKILWFFVKNIRMICHLTKDVCQNVKVFWDFFTSVSEKRCEIFTFINVIKIEIRYEICQNVKVFRDPYTFINLF
jgi:hypothetical protein